MSLIDALKWPYTGAGVLPDVVPQMVEAKRNPNTSKFFTVLGEVHTACRRPSAVDRASPTLFRALRAVLKATAVSGIVNVNYKVRSDGTPAIFEMNFGRPTGDLVAAPPVIVATFLLEYARRAGACPPCSAAQRAVQGGRHRRRCGTFRVRQGGRRGEEQGLQREPVRFVHFMSQHVLPLSSLIRGAADGGGVRAQRSWRTRQPSWPPLN